LCSVDDDAEEKAAQNVGCLVVDRENVDTALDAL